MYFFVSKTLEYMFFFQPVGIRWVWGCQPWGPGSKQGATRQTSDQIGADSISSAGSKQVKLEPVICVHIACMSFIFDELFC